MRLIYEFSLRSFQRQLVYRTAALAGLVTNFFFGIIRIAVLVALYGARHEVAGIPLEGAITFTGLSQAMIGILSLFSWYELMNNVYTGAISSDLLKPMGLYQYWLSHDFGKIWPIDLYICDDDRLRGIYLTSETRQWGLLLL
jgi:ABC-2 type transport system permease protein